jgi:hypothetical protein
MEETRRRALKLADIVAASEELSANVIREATQELNEHLKKLDSRTQKEVMERIRGYS